MVPGVGGLLMAMSSAPFSTHKNKVKTESKALRHHSGSFNCHLKIIPRKLL